MTDLVAKLRAAVLAAMRAGLSPRKAYDEVPSNRIYPYAALGPTQLLPDGEVFQHVDAWSLKLDQGEVAAIGEDLVGLFDRRGCEPPDLAIPGFTVTLQEVQSVELSTDHDAQRTRAMVVLRVVADPDAFESEA